MSAARGDGGRVNGPPDAGTPPADIPLAAAPRGWEAKLDLGFARRGDRSVLAHRRHTGPLVVQKSLHPEGPGVCQAIVVHPPGGIVGGDRLLLSIDVGAGAHAQLTTPGAAKWYRSPGLTASQAIEADVGAAATLEWLPQETILFDGAHAELSTTVTLAADATLLAWDIVRLGRVASGERFARGTYRQRFEVVRDGALIWAERAVLDAGDGLATSPVGLNGCTMFGTFIAVAPTVPDGLVAACRAVAPPAAGGFESAVTHLPGMVIARCRGNSPEAARQWFAAVWAELRPALCARPAMPPRIWNT